MYLYNIIIIYLLIGLLVNYILGINFSTLSCGIFAWVGKDTKFFRRDLFNILGMYNDSRGGDGCGIYYDNNWMKGIGTSAKYEKLIVDYNLHNELKLKTNPVIIGHDRKVSVGSISLDNVQPVVLVDENDNTSFVQAHNGTITNYRALATKYKVDIENGDSDSVVLSKLIDKVGWSILEEYEGSAALVIYNIENSNVLYAFHGRSKASEYAVMSNERPLAYITFPGKGTYISSDIAHLNNLSIPDKKIIPYEFKYNVLYRLEGDTITEELEVHREKLFPEKPKKHYNNYNGTMNGFRYGKRSPIDFHDNTYYITAIRYNGGIYELNGDIVNGVFVLDNWGYVTKSIKFDKNAHYEVGFVHGVMMKDRLAYEIMNKFVVDNKLEEPSDFYDVSNFSKFEVAKMLKKCAATPFWRYHESDNFIGFLKPAIFDKYHNYGGNYYFDGTYNFPLSRYEFKIRTGDIDYGKEDKYLLTLKEFLMSNIGKDLDFSQTEEDKLKLIQSTINGSEDTAKKEDNSTKDNSSNGVELPDECSKCNKWITNQHFCVNLCPVSRGYSDDYDDYQIELGKLALKDSFKTVEDAIDEAVDTYDSLAIDLKSEQISDAITDLKIVKTKLNIN